MGVYIVTVEAWDASGNGWYYEVATLSFSKKSAQSLAARAVTRAGHTGSHSVGIQEIDHYKTGVILVTRKEAAHAAAGSGQPA